MRKFVLSIASGLGSGYSPLMPGTAGSIVGAALFWALRSFSVGPYLATLLGFFSLGVWASSLAEGYYGKKDASQIVIDEVVGMLVTMAFVPFSWKALAIGFFLFRVFDIWKPFPVRLFQDKLPGGWGVMGDDVMAGIYANVVLRLIVRFV